MSRVAVITGANGGLGFETARALARRDMRVVMACRSLEKAHVAQDALLAENPGAETLVLPLDVSEPGSIRAFGRAFAEQVGRLDLLINNAGIALVPFSRNSAGHELNLATNYLGAFALTGTLLPFFRGDAETRVVNVGSLSHRFVALDLADPNWETSAYGQWRAYGRSKLALQSFTIELDRRLRRAGSRVIALAAHPGTSGTKAGSQHPMVAPRNRLLRWINEKVVAALIPSPAAAARSIVHAATAEGVRGGDYYGPSGLLEVFGRPGPARVNPAARDIDLARRLWAWSEAMTGVSYLSLEAESSSIERAVASAQR